MRNKQNIIASIGSTAAVAIFLWAASIFAPCDRRNAAGDKEAPSLWIVLPTEVHRERLRIASVEFAGFEVGEVIVADPTQTAPDAAKPRK